MQQWYQCPYCNTPVQHGQPYCNNCHNQIQWNQPAPIQPQFQPQYQEPKKSNFIRNALIVVGIITVLIIIGMVMPKSNTQSIDTKSNTSSQQTSDIYTYSQKLKDNSSKVGTALTSLGEWCAKPLLLDDSWKVILNARIGALRVFINEGRAIVAPQSLQSINTKYIAGLNHYYKSTELLINGVNTLDEIYINQALSEINAGTSDINEAANLLSAYTNK